MGSCSCSLNMLFGAYNPFFYLLSMGADNTEEEDGNHDHIYNAPRTEHHIPSASAPDDLYELYLFISPLYLITLIPGYFLSDL